MRNPTSINPLLPRYGFVDVVNAQEMMIDDSFNHIENTETEHEAADQQFA